MKHERTAERSWTRGWTYLDGITLHYVTGERLQASHWAQNDARERMNELLLDCFVEEI